MAQSLIFVFGSNQAGIHGKGAAAFAKRWHGAVAGQGEGPQGTAYAIPTKDAQLNPLPLDQIAGHLKTFFRYAQAHPNLHFQITRVGCGLAGYSEDEIYPLVTEQTLPNCYLPGRWLRRQRGEGLSVIVAGGRDYGEIGGERQKLVRDLDNLRKKHPMMEVVSGMARGADRLGYDWAKANDVPIAEFPAQWDVHNKAAGFVRNELMAWYATHLLAYWDGKSRGTRHMIKTAKRDGLTCCVRDYDVHSRSHGPSSTPGSQAQGLWSKSRKQSKNKPTGTPVRPAEAQPVEPPGLI